VTRSVSVLLTSAGRRVELVRAFQGAGARLSLDVRVLATDINPLAPALYAADARFIVPASRNPEFVPELLRICTAERVDLVLPLTDHDIPVIARHREAFRNIGTRPGVVSAEAAELTRDKWRTKGFFAGLDLPIARGWTGEEVDPDAVPYPAFVKPRDGSAGQHAFLVRTPAELRFFLNYVPFPMVEERLPGPEITTDVVCGLDGRLRGLVSRRRLEVRGGEVVKGVTVRDTAILDGCRRIAEALPGCGPMTVQCMLLDGTPRFTEINARFGGGSPLGIAAGVHGPALLLAEVADVHYDCGPPGTFEEGLYVSRFDDAVFLREGDLSDVVRRRL
jgi:carbamoyl-phosphate synthase large subunit